MEQSQCCNCRGHSQKTVFRAVIKLLYRQAACFYLSLNSSFRTQFSFRSLILWNTAHLPEGIRVIFPCPKPQRWLSGERKNCSGQTELPSTQTGHQSVQQRDKQLWRMGTNTERGENLSEKGTRGDESILKISWPSSPRPVCPQQKGRTKKEGGRRHRGFFQPSRAFIALRHCCRAKNRTKLGCFWSKGSRQNFLEPPDLDQGCIYCSV